uniref:Uncharacterized protein n=1 Tax=Cucumis melo TaxID=3656 RepID=A0A9I9EHM0_CUCME
MSRIVWGTIDAFNKALGVRMNSWRVSGFFRSVPLKFLSRSICNQNRKVYTIAKNNENDLKSCDNKETPHLNKICSTARRVAALAAERGWRVYLYDEHGSTAEAKSHMISKQTSARTNSKSVGIESSTFAYNSPDREFLSRILTFHPILFFSPLDYTI